MIKCEINNKVYIGQSGSVFTRIRAHLNHSDNSYFKKDYMKYGITNFSFKFLKICEGLEDLCKYEAYYINLYDSCNPEKGYNQLSGLTKQFINGKVVIVCPVCGEEYKTKNKALKCLDKCTKTLKKGGVEHERLQNREFSISF